MSQTPSTPMWKNPYVIAFVLGAVFLTVLPFLQGRFIAAPPPLGKLPAFSLPTQDGGTLSETTLSGKVWLANFLPPTCLDVCQIKQEEFTRTLEHVEDLDGGIALVSFASAGTAMRPSISRVPGRWEVVVADEAAYQPLQAALRELIKGVNGVDAGVSMAELARLPVWMLVDQEGAVRGFWRSDAEGRGNSINAARLLAKKGPRP